jgi:hypothetical protein
MSDKNRILDGVTVKLSDVFKRLEGDNVRIFHCGCMKSFLFSNETEDRSASVYEFYDDHTQCPKCHMYPWMRKKVG